MKQLFKIVSVFSFSMLFINSCNNGQPTSVKDSAVNSPTNVNSLVQGFIPVTPDKLFYQAGDTIKFYGKVTDSNGKGSTGAQVGIDDPVQLACMLGPKTDNDGKFTYSVNLPSTAKGIYAFAFYCNTSKSYSAITVTPSTGLQLSNDRYEISWEYLRQAHRLI